MKAADDEFARLPVHVAEAGFRRHHIIKTYRNRLGIGRLCKQR